MFLNDWLRSLRSRLTTTFVQQGRKHRPRKDRPVCRPRLEALENRLTPATYIVNSTGDAASQDGVSPDTGNTVNGQPEITLRSAIQAADTASVSSSISFDIPTTDPGYNNATGQFLIQPQTFLPPIEVPVVIDGYSQPGASPNTLAVGDNAVLPITIDGSLQSVGLELDAGNSTVQGLAIQNCTFSLIVVGPNNTIRGNVVSATSSAYVDGQFGIALAGTPGGSPDSPNDVISNTILGGTTPADRNVISGSNENVAIYPLSYPGSPGAVVEGNYIGTNRDGTAAATFQPQGGYGIEIASDNNTIGGTAPGAGNVISGNGSNAVSFVNNETVQPPVLPITGNVIQGNLIGTDASGTQPVPNGAGIVFPSTFYPTSNTSIGGTVPGAGNTIAFNNGPGVWVPGDSTDFTPYSTGVRIEGNSIYDNAGLGIDLGDTLDANGNPIPNGASSNTANDAANHVGGNNLMNFPVLSSASSSASGTTISGTLGTGTANGQPFLPNTPITLDFYANASPDPSGYGQGQTWLGSTTVTTDANGNVTFAADLAASNLAGQWISAIATDPSGDTSEFSADVQATTAPSQTFAQSLQATLPQSSSTANSITIQASSSTTPATVIPAVNGLTGVTQPVTVILDLGGGTYSSGGYAANPPANVTFQIVNGTLDPTVPALTVAGGQVAVLNCILTTTGNAPTILVTGGSLTLRNDDVVQASATATAPAVSVTGGTVDLGTATSPGGNTLNVSGSGQVVQATTAGSVSAVGDTFESNGSPLPASLLSFTSLVSSSANDTSLYGQSVTFTATVSANGSGAGTPTGSVDFFDTTTGTDLGTVPLSGGSASLTTAKLAAGINAITATYSGDSTFLASSTAAPLLQQASAGIILLDPTGQGALTDTGNGNVDVKGGSIVVNSSSSAAVVVSGNGNVTAPLFDVNGGISTTGSGHVVGQVQSGSAADPLASLAAPDPSSLTVQSTSPLHISGSQTVTLNPGVYVGGIQISDQAHVTLNPGIYYVEGGGFSVSGNGSVTDLGKGVLLYNAPSSTSDTISLTGNGKVNLSPMTSGPYQGITFFQDRASTAPITITGNGNLDITGAIYAAHATLNITGNGDVDAQGNPLDSIGLALIVYDLKISGNGDFSVTVSSGP